MITDNKRHLYSLVSLYVRHDSACNLDRNFVPNIQYIGIYNIYADILILHAQRAKKIFLGLAENANFPLFSYVVTISHVTLTNWALCTQFGLNNWSTSLTRRLTDDRPISQPKNTIKCPTLDSARASRGNT